MFVNAFPNFKITETFFEQLPTSSCWHFISF